MPRTPYPRPFCARCGGKTNGKRLCEVHLESERERFRRRAAEKKALELCCYGNCLEDALEDEWYCDHHRRIYTIKRRARNRLKRRLANDPLRHSPDGGLPPRVWRDL